jgi:hypothetical protein
LLFIYHPISCLDHASLLTHPFIPPSTLTITMGLASKLGASLDVLERKLTSHSCGSGKPGCGRRTSWWIPSSWWPSTQSCWRGSGVRSAIRATSAGVRASCWASSACSSSRCCFAGRGRSSEGRSADSYGYPAFHCQRGECIICPAET